MPEHKWIEASLKAFKKVMNKYHILFWLEYGTQLGAVREGRIIPWDKDGDIGIFISSIPTIREHVEDFEKEGLLLDFQDGHLFVSYKINDREWVATLDVYTFALYEYNAKNWVVRIENGKIFDIRSPIEYYKTMKGIYFLDEIFLIPSQAEKALEFVYGKKWKKPIEIKPEAYKLENPTPKQLNKYGRTGRKQWKDVD